MEEKLVTTSSAEGSTGEHRGTQRNSRGTQGTTG